jgi:hypothetical protein
MVGVDFVEGQRTRIDLGAHKGEYMTGNRRGRLKATIRQHADDDRSDFQESMPLRVEAGCFDIDDDGQESPKARRDAFSNLRFLVHRDSISVAAVNAKYRNPVREAASGVHLRGSWPMTGFRANEAIGGAA